MLSQDLTTKVHISAAARVRSASRRPSGLGSTPPNAVSLAMGEPGGPTPLHVVEAGVSALQSGRTKYEALSGNLKLREAVAAYLRESAPALSSDNVVITHGGSAGLAATVLAMLNPGDRVIIPEPTYSVYVDQLALVGAEPVWMSQPGGEKLNAEALEELASTARMIILCNPVNPTGDVFDRKDLTAIGNILQRHPDLLLLADEAYCDIVFDASPFYSALELSGVQEQVIVSRTFSKSFAMTGWRIGYVVASDGLAEDINLVHRTLNGALNTFVQDAALQALQVSQDDLEQQRRSYESRRDIVVEELSGVEGISLSSPSGAFYAFPKVRSHLSSDELTALLASNGVLVRSGTEFGDSGEGHVRLSFACSEQQLREGLKKFKAVLAEVIK